MDKRQTSEPVVAASLTTLNRLHDNYLHDNYFAFGDRAARSS
jgi:hypothetical protein